MIFGRSGDSALSLGTIAHRPPRLILWDCEGSGCTLQTVQESRRRRSRIEQTIEFLMSTAHRSKRAAAIE
jgi:hypothetical protein